MKNLIPTPGRLITFPSWSLLYLVLFRYVISIKSRLLLTCYQNIIHTTNLVFPYLLTRQGVQDKLDDPFDGMSEDDINLDTLDEWTLQSLEATYNRTYKIGRFQVTADECKTKSPMQTAQHPKCAETLLAERKPSRQVCVQTVQHYCF